MKTLALRLITSKKFLAAIIPTLLILINKFAGLGIPADDLTKISAFFVAFILGQGIADHGKEKALAEIKASKPNPKNKQRSRGNRK